MSYQWLQERDAESIVRTATRAVSKVALARATEIVAAVREKGDSAVLEYAQQFDELRDGRHLFQASDCHEALTRIGAETRALLERCAERVASFAAAQRDALTDVEHGIPGGAAGHRIIPLERAGCYVPGGRYPLVSSLLMSVVTARAAGVAQIWVATPRPSDEMLAAAAIAGATGVIGVGGAHGIAALAFGFAGVPGVDCIVGPGNSYVTAAKLIVSSQLRIDMLAGPSELLVIADETASPMLVAADLLAQAEHDIEAVPVLITTTRAIADAVDREIGKQLTELSSAETSKASLRNGFVTVVPTLVDAARIANTIAPEHLQLSCAESTKVAPLFTNYGGLFIGEGSAEVLGDYCAGPNHVLPTGGTGRFRCGLSVLDFIKVATWLRIDSPAQAASLYADAAALATIEGLPGHKRAALERIDKN